MRARREFSHEFETAFARKFECSLFFDDILLEGTHPSEGIAPVYDGDVPCGLHDASRFAQDRQLVGHLKEKIGDENEIHGTVGGFRGARHLEIGPDDVEVVEAAALCFVRASAQEIALHVDRVYAPASFEMLRDCKRIRATPG